MRDSDSSHAGEKGAALIRYQNGGGLYEGTKQMQPAYENAGAPVDATTLANIAKKGSLLVDTTNGQMYQNTGTKASPVWTKQSTDTANGLTAAGTTRADALALTASINRVGTAAASTGVILPAAKVNQPILVINDGANAIKVYGAGSDTIDGVAATTGVTLTNAKRAWFIPTASGAYVSLMGVPSA